MREFNFCDVCGHEPPTIKKKEMERIIGKDEKLKKNDPGFRLVGSHLIPSEIRNQLRAELRSKIKKL